jgi:hypothetical protein
MTTAGPALSAAAIPVNENRPAPIIAPTQEQQGILLITFF